MDKMTEKILSSDKAHSWHPFTQMKHHSPVVIDRAEGIFLFTPEGRKIYDSVSSWWTSPLGHCNKEILQAITDQGNILEHVMFAGFTHKSAALLFDALHEILPDSLSRYFFTDNGSTGNEVSLKMAFQFWQNKGFAAKTKFMMIENSYHGDTLGAVSVGGVDLYHKIFHPLMFETHKAKSPNCSICPHRKSEFTFDANNTGCSLECLASAENIIKEHHDEICALIIEPLIQAAGGMIIYPEAYLEKITSFAKEYNILVIFDEVATGFGRTGSMFAMNKINNLPDIAVFSKALTGGWLPLSVTASTDEIFDAFYDDDRTKTLFHGHSYTGNPISCSAAVKALEIYKRDNFPQSNEKAMFFFHSKLKALSDYDFISDIRYLGWIGAVDLKDKKGKALESETMSKIYSESLKNGVILRPLGNTIYWWLPINTTEDQIDEIIKISISTVTSVLK